MNNIKGFWIVQLIGLVVFSPIAALLGMELMPFVAGYLAMGVIGMMAVCR